MIILPTKRKSKSLKERSLWKKNKFKFGVIRILFHEHTYTKCQEDTGLYPRREKQKIKVTPEEVTVEEIQNSEDQISKRG